MRTLITLTGPSGVGKTTIETELTRIENLDIFRRAIAFTSRKPREGEKTGRDYDFLQPDEISRLKGQGKIAAISEIHGNTYGHTKDSITETCFDGEVKIAITDLERIAQYKKFGKEVGIRVISLLILPPSEEELIRRLEVRYQKNPDLRTSHDERWAQGLRFIKEGQKLGAYDDEVTNDNIQAASMRIRKIVLKHCVT